ncbi:hypothetical protein K3495_g6282 [Podosphaera aphanis]|nr:hypothetical protein K3495_g6282 [Podosphaera aphanis]
MIWKILPRSQNPAVDKILNCLEIGAADALKRGYLSKLQLSIHSVDYKIISDLNLIESYTLIFEYEDGQDGQDLRVSSKFDVKSVAVRNAKQDLYGLVNDVGFLIHHNNRYRSSDLELPAQFRILMSLKYNDKAPVDYQPPMFHPGDENTIKILGSCFPNPNLKMMTGFHSVSVGIHISETEETTPLRQSSAQNLVTESATEGITHFSSKPMTLGSPLTDELHTQPDAVKQLQKIGIYRDKNSDTQDTVFLDSNLQRKESLVINKLGTKLNLAAYTRKVTDRFKQILANNMSSEPCHKILKCECLIKAENEAFLNCAMCRNLKHARCYGYIDRNIPIEVICYSCLLQHDEEDRIEKIMKPLSIKRRALYYLRDMGILSYSAELASHLNMPKNKVARLLADFKAEGFLKGRRKDKRSGPMATYIGNDETLRKLYFQPQRGIDHLLIRPELLTKFPEKDIFDKETPKMSDEVKNFLSSAQVIASKNLSNNEQFESISATHPTQTFTPSVFDVNYSDQLHKLPESNSLASSSTQGTPSPGPVVGKPLTYRERSHSDLRKIDEITPRKRSFAVMRSDFPAEIESAKLPRMSKASPWLIRNC